MPTRRDLFVLLAAGLVTPATAQPRDPLWLSARGGAGGRFFASGFDAEGQLAFDLPLPGRGHAFAARPDGAEAVLFGRRPGDFALAVDLATGIAARRVPAAEGRWFNGHGAFAADGRFLYATETRAADGGGVIGVYAADAAYRRVGEVPSGGLDPHEIRLLPDGETLVVANGGLLTHPDAPRLKFNVDSMQPSLAWIDARTGSILRQAPPPADLHQLSTRHLALAADGSVVVAMQWEGPRGEAVPLIARHRPGAATLEMLDLPQEILAALDGYCGSAAVDVTGQTLAVSSPRGGCVVFWDLGADRMIDALRLDDGCGLAAAGQGGFILSNGLGRVLRYQPGKGAPARIAIAGLAQARWDNHITAVG